MNKDKRNNIQLLGTLNNSDESGIIANANQVYDANEDKSTQDVSKEHKERIETLETKESSMQTTLENISKTGEASAASNVTYNHNDSQLDATNVQQAIDEVYSKGNTNRENDKTELEKSISDNKTTIDNSIQDVYKKSNYNDGETIIDFNTIHLITDNPEYICVAVDADEKILYGIKTDGQPYFGVGCPQQVKDYIDEQINKILGTNDITTTIDSLKEIEAFLKDFTNSDTLKKLLDLKANVDEVRVTTNDIYKKSNPNDSEGNVIDTNTIHIITDNPEFVIAAVDVNDRILYGIKSNGQPYWGIGVPKVVRDYVDKQVNDILGTNNITETIDSLKEVEKFLSDFKNSDTLKALLDTKANKVDVVFDISAYHATGGTLATYDNLEDALGTNGNNIPSALRKSGMSVKFVQSSDNKYVQYLYKAASTAVADFMNVNNWEKINLENEIKQLKGIFANRFIFLATTGTYVSKFVDYHFIKDHSYFVHIEYPEGVDVETYISVRASDGTALQNGVGWGSATRDIHFTCNVDNGEKWYLTVVPAHDTEFSFNATIIDHDVVSLAAIKAYLDSDGYVTNSKIANNAVTSGKANFTVLPNVIIAPNVTPNVNTQYGYISFGTGGGALCITTVKGRITIEGDSYKTDGEYRAYFKDGTTDTASSIIFIYIDTIDKKFVPRGTDRVFNDTQSRYILLGSVVCAYTPDGSYEPNSFQRASFPFEYTVNGSSGSEDIDSMKSYTPYGTDILTLNPSNEILPILKNFKHRIRNASFVEQAKQLVLLQLTDQHGDETRMNRAMRFASKYSSYIDDVIHTGDIVYDNWANGIDWFANVQNKENIMQVIGNHDVAIKSGSDGKVYIDPNDLSQYIETTGYVHLNKTDHQTLGYKNTDNEMVWVDYDGIYNRYIAPYVSNWGVVQPSNAALEGLNYYYKDYTEQGIRLIVLDCMMYDTAQNTWLVSVLADAKANGYAVIIAEHYPIQLDGFEYCAFTSSGGDDVLDFYQSEGYASTLANAQLAVDNFMSAGGEFICWLAGHTHKDFCGTLKNYPKQVMIVSDITGLNHLLWGDGIRTVGTKTEDCFSVIAVDRYKKIVRTYRVGNQWDRYGRHKVSMAFDYRAAKMVYSS